MGPNTKYLFIQDVEGEEIDYLVFKSGGDTFANETPFLSIQNLFSQKVSGYIIEDVLAGQTQYCLW